MLEERYSKETCKSVYTDWAVTGGKLELTRRNQTDRHQLCMLQSGAGSLDPCCKHHQQQSRPRLLIFLPYNAWSGMEAQTTNTLSPLAAKH
ncbi:hypothetical protein DPMN_011397 [Dreissena polymorpha]|uniref:Uncharacterized protein n=1 Tax=Dreissena polymorpha TaxID=45954 RepID=A0A9D4N3Y5_DREPO|nr:hypothetical protein DPMN_011397 [Dreissena polymorpha]